MVLADFEMRETEFAFLVLQNTLDRPAAEANMQPGLEPIFERVPDEEPLFLFRVQGIVNPDELVTAEYLIAA